jgi:hypothetical protein
VSFVRNQKLADVHIMSTSSHTGSGGHKYFLNFIGQNNFEGQDIEYEYISEQFETSDERREGLLKILKIGILHYYAKTNFFDELEKEESQSDFQINTGFDIEKVTEAWKTEIQGCLIQPKMRYTLMMENRFQTLKMKLIFQHIMFKV